MSEPRKILSGARRKHYREAAALACGRCRRGEPLMSRADRTARIDIRGHAILPGSPGWIETCPASAIWVALGE